MGFYVDGNCYFGLSVNGGFFGVNIDLSPPIMHLIISGYEFGQWLRVLLWICLPGTVFLTILATWMNYRRGRVPAGLLTLQMEGLDEGESFSAEPAGIPKDRLQDERVDTERNMIDAEHAMTDTQRSVKEGEDDYKESLYKGILWMKEKYEQYRDMADDRHERLKDKLAGVEKKYEDLLMRVQNTNPELLETGATALATGRGWPAGESGWGGSPRLMEVRAEEFPPESRPIEFSGETEIIVERAEAGGDRIRIHELEEQLARTQQRFDEEVARLRYQLDDEIARGRRLQDEKNAGLDANRLLEQQVLHFSRQLEEKQRMIADLEGQLVTDRLKIEDLVTKLRNNSTLLMNIYQELDKSLHFNDGLKRE
jgi:hypothetical protein